MKIDRRFLAAMAALTLLAFAFVMQMPHRYHWDPTFSHTDSQPFGAQLLDSVLSRSMPQGYSVSTKALWQVAQEPEAKNILWVTSDRVVIDATLWQSILSIMERGGKVMIAANDLSSQYQPSYHNTYDFDDLDDEKDSATTDTTYIDFATRPTVYPNQDIGNNYLNALADTDTIMWDPLSPNPQTFFVPAAFVSGYIQASDINYGQQYEWQPLAKYCINVNEWWTTDRVVVASKRYGKGEMFIVSMPLLFTNCGIMDPSASELLFKIMSQLSDRPTVRLDLYQREAIQENVQTSLLRAIIKQPPLRWACNLALLAILLFFIFNARRRQRVIPVIPEPQNHTLEFTKLVGSLYFEENNLKDLMIRKWTLFAMALRRSVGVDVETDDDDQQLFRVLAERTGMPVDKVARIIRRLRDLAKYDEGAGSSEYKRAIDDMDKIQELTR